jgi:hypothetical protein
MSVSVYMFAICSHRGRISSSMMSISFLSNILVLSVPDEGHSSNATNISEILFTSSFISNQSLK